MELELANKLCFATRWSPCRLEEVTLPFWSHLHLAAPHWEAVPPDHARRVSLRRRPDPVEIEAASEIYFTSGLRGHFDL